MDLGCLSRSVSWLSFLLISNIPQNPSSIPPVCPSTDRHLRRLVMYVLPVGPGTRIPAWLFLFRRCNYKGCSGKAPPAGLPPRAAESKNNGSKVAATICEPATIWLKYLLAQTPSSFCGSRGSSLE